MKSNFHDLFPNEYKERWKNFHEYTIAYVKNHEEYFFVELFNQYRKESIRFTLMFIIEQIEEQKLSEFEYESLWHYVGFHICPLERASYRRIFLNLHRMFKEGDCSRPLQAEGPTRRDHILDPDRDLRTEKEKLKGPKRKRTAYRKPKSKK